VSGARGVLAALCCAVLAAAVAADDAAPVDERITDFASHIVVAVDGQLTITETIAVVAGGEQIKRGIYRDFPTIYGGAWGTRVEVPFEVAAVTRDGRPEPSHRETQENGVRVYIGDADVTLPPGPYVYTITYRTARQLGFFADHDELYWNATGNGWAFPIERASATVQISASIPPAQVRVEGYTGPAGATDRNLIATVDPASGAARFATTQPLGSYEGLTIVVSVPKGFIQPPSEAAQRDAWLASNRHLLAGAAGLGIVLLYLVGAWLVVGRDPSRGTIIPRFTPPLELDAPGVRYVGGLGWDERCFTAALVSLAVKRWVRIDEQDGAFTLASLAERTTPLSATERRVYGALFTTKGETLALERANHGRLRAAIAALQAGLALEYDGKLFRANQGWIWPGVALSVATLLAVGWYGPGAGALGVAMMLVWLGIWSFACMSLVENVTRGWRDALRPGVGVLTRVFALLFAVVATAISLPFLAGEAFGLFALTQMTTIWSAPLLLLLAAANWWFVHLLKQPTANGQRVLDAIDGFRMYLTTAEGDELRQAPPKTPQQFEAMLPFAIALGVEPAWSERFADVLAEAAARGERGAYQPGWYHGRSWHDLGARGFTSMVGASLSSAIASSSTPPGASSGRSGGSPGGGGGGGGGGGW